MRVRTVVAAVAITPILAAVTLTAPAQATIRGTAECDTFKAGLFSGTGKVCLAATWSEQADGRGTKIRSLNFWSPDGEELEASRALDFSPLLIKSRTGVLKWSTSGSLTRDEAYVGFNRTWSSHRPRIGTRVGYVCVFWKAHVDGAPDDSGSFCIRIT